MIRRYDGNQWVTEAEGDTRVEAWIERNFPLSSKTFHSSVVLQQGKADRFLIADPKDRRDILTQLLQMDFYQKLDELAVKRRNEVRKRYEEKLQEFNNLSSPTDEQVSEQRALIKQMEGELKAQEIKLKDKEQELRNAQESQRLLSEIDSRQQQQHRDSALCAQAEHIQEQATRFRQLRDGIRLLDALWMARHELTREEQVWQQHQQQIERLKIQLQDAERQVDQHHQAQFGAETQVARVAKQLEECRQEQDIAIKRLEQLQQVESIEQRIMTEERKLAASEPLLQRQTEIQQKFQRYEELSAVIPLLENIEQIVLDLGEAEKRMARAKESVQLLDEEIHNVSIEELRLKQNAEEVAATVQKLHQDINTCNSQITFLNDKLTERSKADDADECPTCGSRLDDLDVRERLKHERREWEEKVASFKVEEQRLQSLLIKNETEEQRQQRSLKQQGENIKQILLQRERLRSDYTHAQNAVARYKGDLAKAQERAGELSSQLGLLDQLKRELLTLSKITTEKEKLNSALQIAASVNAAITTLCEQLKQLPDYSLPQRVELRTAINELEHKNVTTEQVLREAQDHLA
ncbi:MAG TPA: hypothetical protein VEF04_13925, partial [Blastocatellia bacterium]|nr:hypothetical protein [Blastocatellia bacterium]